VFHTIIFGIAFEADLLSNINQSQSTFDTAQIAVGFMSIIHLYVLIQPSLETHLLITFEDVFFQICITLAPVSWFCQALANAIHKWSAFE